MRLQLVSHAGGLSDQFMSFPNKNQPLPPVPAPSKSTQRLNRSSSSPAEWSPLSSQPIPENGMGPPHPPPTHISEAQFQLNQSMVRPTTVDGALDWISRHKRQIDQFFNILEQYPQLAQSDRLDAGKNPLPPIKRSVSESAAYPPRQSRATHSQMHSRHDNRFRRKKHRSGDSIVPNEQGKSLTDNADKNPDLAAGERYIYVCDVMSDSRDSSSQSSSVLSSALPSPREKIVTALSSYCFVRTGPDRLHSDAELFELTHTIADADAFVLLLNDRVLASGTCLHQLAVAAAYDLPIISVRESGFKLPEKLSPELYEIEIIPVHERGDTDNHNMSVENENSRNEQETNIQQTDRHESQSSGFHSESEEDDTRHSSLADLINDCYTDSLLYVPNFHNSCISKLLGKLSEYLGDAYLDFEVSQQNVSGGEETVLINDRMTIPRIGNTSSSIEFPVMNNGMLKRVRSSNDGEETPLSMPSKRESANLPESPMSVDRSSSTPNNMTAKLPPISKSSAQESRVTKSNVQTRESNLTSSDRLSPDDSIEPQESQYSAQSSTMDSDQSDWDLSPESSPFLETKYVVFPSHDSGFEKRPPFTVHFPQDISTIDRRRSSASTDDYGFNCVHLDLKYDVIAPSPLGFVMDNDEEEQTPKKASPKKDGKTRAKKPTKPVQVRMRNNRPVREMQLVKMATISIKYGMPV